MATIDDVLASANNAVTRVIDAWGAAKVAQIDAQAQPAQPAPAPSYIQFAGDNKMTLAAIVILTGAAIFLIVKKG